MSIVNSPLYAVDCYIYYIFHVLLLLLLVSLSLFSWPSINLFQLNTLANGSVRVRTVYVRL